MFVSICLGLSYEPFYSVTRERSVDPLYIPLDGLHYTTLCQCVPKCSLKTVAMLYKDMPLDGNAKLESRSYFGAEV